MSNIPAHDRKRILADPVVRFSHHHPQVSSEHIAKLQTLAQQYADLQEQHKNVRKKARQLSRLIGNARANGEDADVFLESMQQHSKQLKSLAVKLTATGNQILDYFEPAEDEISNEKPLANRWKQDSGKVADCPEICISLEDKVRDDWNHYVETNPAASIYHRGEWKGLIKKTFGHSGYYFAARNSNGEITGILPLICLSSRLFGNFMVSIPYFNYGGAVADHPLIEQQLIQAGTELAKDLGLSYVEYRDNIPRDAYPVRTNKVNMVLQLPGNHDALWQKFTPKLRAQIKRPQREQPQILEGGEEYLNHFYTVFSRNMRDLGTPVYPRSFFRHILNSFPGACRIVVILHDRKPVSAAFLIGYHDTLEIPWASTIRDVNHLSMNMLLYWEVLKYAIDKHYRQFDLGRSSKNSGTYRFKQQWGARPRQLYWHYWLKQGTELPALNPDNPRYALAIKIWRQLPLAMTTWLGPLIVKNLP